MPPSQTRIVLRARPEGLPQLDDFAAENVPVPELAPGEVLVRTDYLGLDPYLRGRMGSSSLHSSGRAPVALGSVMEGAIVGEVVASSHPDVKVGDLVAGPGGWQEYAVLPGTSVRRLDPNLAPISTALGVLGMPGLTAYAAVRQIGRPTSGETFVVAAASGTVGSLAGQIARLDGARTIGIAGGDQKLAWLRTAGFDVALDHRDPLFAQKLVDATPAGIDIYVENVGGAVTQAVWPRLNRRARIAVCGVASVYSAVEAIPNVNLDGLMSEMVTKGITMQGFAFTDFEYLRSDFEHDVARWLDAGDVVHHEDLVEGLLNAPTAFIDMLQGRHIGKRLVQVGPVPTND